MTLQELAIKVNQLMVNSPHLAGYQLFVQGGLDAPQAFEMADISLQTLVETDDGEFFNTTADAHNQRPDACVVADVNVVLIEGS